MKIFKILVTLLVISLLVSSCTSPSTDSAEKIIAPKNKLLPIEGTWEIFDILTTETVYEEEQEQWLGTKVQFSTSYMFMGQSVLENPQYQMKRIKGEQYVLFNSKSLPVNFAFPKNEVEVITVIDDDKFFCEVLIIKENELILKIQNNSFYLSKISNKVLEYVSEEYNIEANKSNVEKKAGTTSSLNITNTGVLIGLRSLSENKKDFLSDYSYRTVWVSSENGKVNSILEMENIFFPRRSGFWKLQVEEIAEDNKTEQYIVANNVLMEDNKEEKLLKNRAVNIEALFIKKDDTMQEPDFTKWGEKTGEVKRKINYVSNDFISTEIIGKGGYVVGDETWEKNKLQLVPVDGLLSGQGIKITDILEDVGAASMKTSLDNATSYLEIDDYNILYKNELLENFGLDRKLGHWFLKGRINYIKDEKFNVIDYNINLIPPSKVVVYDTLHVAWTNIKDRVPRAIDAYTSPNKDIAIVFTKNELLIYNIYGSRLGKHPIERLQLKEEETAIMMEWATGHYVNGWEGIFQKSGGQKIIPASSS